MNRPSHSSRPVHPTCVSDIATTPPDARPAPHQERAATRAQPLEQTHCRAKALEWLKADLAIRLAQIQNGKPEQATDARGKLRYWRNDARPCGRARRASARKT